LIHKIIELKRYESDGSFLASYYLIEISKILFYLHVFLMENNELELAEKIKNLKENYMEIFNNH